MRVLIALICAVLLCSCHKNSTINVSELKVVDQPFSEWINQDFKPEPPRPVGFKEESDWTGWNRFWFGSSLTMLGADLLTTNQALDRGCVEGNPLLGDSMGSGDPARRNPLAVPHTTTHNHKTEQP